MKTSTSLKINFLQDEYERHLNFENWKDMRGEHAFIRTAMEQVINGIGEDDISTYMPMLEKMTNQLVQIGTFCHKMELQNNMLIDEAKLSIFAQEVITAITEIVTDPDQITEISERILKSMEEQFEG